MRNPLEIYQKTTETALVHNNNNWRKVISLIFDELAIKHTDTDQSQRDADIFHNGERNVKQHIRCLTRRRDHTRFLHVSVYYIAYEAERLESIILYI